ncbi:MAG: adenylyltransferase [Candidatus Parcubacteria bacterium]|nr:MAG: adenylyltransferase [Candidatus Parcubacteria bacterium]
MKSITFLKRFLIKIITPERYRWYKHIKQMQYCPQEQLLEFQKNLLFNILKYSSENVPYYSEIIKKNKINISRESIFDVIKRFPILTKKDIRDNFDLLIARNFKGKFKKNTSGGSTGEPIILLQDYDFNEKGAAVKYIFEEWAGGGLCEKLVKLWGSERDILEGTIGFKAKISNFLHSRKFLNAFKMSEQDMFEFVKIINEFKPKVIEAYVQSIYELARFIDRNNLEIHSPNGIIVSAGVLYDDVKDFIKRIFKTKILNRYGSREVGDIACSCDKDNGLHINIFNHYVEILNEHLEPCKAGELGSIYITTLHNKVMPLIRYKIEDMAIVNDRSICDCGRGMPIVIKNVKGRMVNIFKTKNGTLIDGEYFTHLFYFKDWVKKFQVIQKDYNLIEIKVVGQENSKDIQEINNAIQKVMGQDCKINWYFVDEIEPAKSGKFLYTISYLEK